MLAHAVERLPYQDDDFQVIREILYHHSGIRLHEGKKELVYSRLAKRIRKLGLNCFNDYCSMIDRDSDELLQCINFLTTNVTSFFREQHHFDFLVREVLPGKDKVRIWSAGCSSGEEPYSIAFTCGQFPEIQTEIVATDLDSNVLRKARTGVYKDRDVAGIPESELKHWFLKGTGSKAGHVRVRDTYASMVNFYQLNLKQDWAHEEKFDVIFCRNVMIYFDNELRTRLLKRFHQHLKPGGYLVLGHSESLFGLSDRFSVVGKTVHRVKDAG